MKKVYKNLKDIKVHDKIQIGVEGVKGKYEATVIGITKSDKIKTNTGDYFNRDGSIWKRKSYYTKGTKCKIFATPITQRDFNRRYHKVNIDFLKDFDWDHCTDDQLQAIFEILPVKLANKLQISNFK